MRKLPKPMLELERALATLNIEPSDPASCDTKRVFHGRGHCYPGLEAVNIDFFAPSGLLLVTLYQAQEEGFCDALLSMLKNVSVVKSTVVQRRYLDKSPSEVLLGEVSDKVAIQERGLNYWIYPAQQQNLGFFLDMLEGRRWVQDNAKDANVLNLFAYTCAFSVAAIAGGASQVINLDMSRSSLSKGRYNHRLNDQDVGRVKFLGHELFKSWGKVKRLGPYELVIIDPPSFQKGSFVATKDYQRVLRRLPDITEQGSNVLVCLNDPNIGSDFLIDLMKEHCPSAEFVERLPLPATFKEKDLEKGLKTLVFKMT